MKLSLVRIWSPCLALFMLAGCDKGTQQAPPAPQQVGVIAAQPRNVPLTKDLVGRLSAYRSANVSARVSGVLLKRVYTEGSEVKQGQLLFQIDPAPLKAALDAALAQFAQAQATYANDHVIADRSRALAPKGAISKSDLDTALANERVAAASVQGARASVETARINLGYASVTSPINGRAGQQQVTEGALVGNGAATLLTTVDQLDPLYVNFSMGVSELVQMRRAQGNGDVSLSNPGSASVQVNLPGGTPYAKQGTVDFSAAAVDAATGAVNLRALIPNPGFVLLPGMYVTLKAQFGEQHNIFLIPQPAVQRDTNGTYVFTVSKDNKVLRSNVTTSDMSGPDWIVTSGLKSGDQVIVSGVQKAKEGAQVITTPWHPQPADNQTAMSAPAGSSHGK